MCVVGGGVYFLEILPNLGERHGRSSLYIQGLEKVRIVVMFWGKLKETFFFNLVNDGYVCVCVCVQLCPTLFKLWTEAHQAPLSMGFSRQEYGSELPVSSSRGSSRPKD